MKGHKLHVALTLQGVGAKSHHRGLPHACVTHIYIYVYVYVYVFFFMCVYIYVSKNRRGKSAHILPQDPNFRYILFGDLTCQAGYWIFIQK